jgi:hypothetical protein
LNYPTLLKRNGTVIIVIIIVVDVSSLKSMHVLAMLDAAGPVGTAF